MGFEVAPVDSGTEGAHGYSIKPIGIKRLIDEVDRLIKR
jgi:hypothetical protein